MTTNYIEAPAGALQVGFSVNYEITVGGKKRMTTGTVEKIRRVGKLVIEITLKHRKTGEVHVNTMDARQAVYVWAIFLQPGYTEEIHGGLGATGLAHMGVELAELWTESLVDQLRAVLKENMWKFAGMPIAS